MSRRQKMANNPDIPFPERAFSANALFLQLLVPGSHNPHSTAS
jgi:hypothetical protein